ncbi:MAG: acyltransferase, partial [Armatimonadota bacterium]
HELMFYILFLLFFVSNKVFSAFCSLWLAVMLLPPFGENLGPVFKVLFNPINLEFIAGLVCALLYRKFRTINPSVTVILGIGLLIAFFVSSVDIANRYLFAIPFGLIVLGSSAASSAGNLKIPRFPVFLGDASYSIYLVHIPVISLVSRIIAKAAPASDWEAAFLCCAGASVIAGSVYHGAIEKPAIRAFKQLISPRATSRGNSDKVPKPAEV